MFSDLPHLSIISIFAKYLGAVFFGGEEGGNCCEVVKLKAVLVVRISRIFTKSSN